MDNKLKTAFTLVELLVVIAIVGILSGLIIVGMSSSVNNARIAKAQIFASSLRDSLLINLISEWDFDTVSGTIDSVLADTTSVPDTWGNNNGLTYGAGPTLRNGNNCVYGQCLQFDGTNDYIDIANVNNLKYTTGTLSAWFKWTSQNSGLFFSLTDKDTSSYFMQFGLGDWTGTYSDESMGFIYIDGTNRIICYYRNGHYTYRDSKWHNAVITVGANYNKMFLDGNELPLTYVSGSSSTGGYFSQDANFDTAEIGARLYNSTTRDQYLGGLMDDLRLYNGAMPTSTIKKQYYLGLSKLLAKGEINREEYKDRIISYNE